ncbi:MAG: undecaprenyl-diphosphate phosphatase [Verrucomicrobia bacterium]|nr:undecaprenyl-diphosphate phosphatase [Verrucomicrobiota bacterium]
MSDWLFAVLLGLIEGVTEFLPVSSTGHLLIAERLAGRHYSDLFNTVIQIGAVLAVLAVFADRVRGLLTRWSEPANQDYLFKLAAAFVVTAIGGLALKKAGLRLPKTLTPVAWATLVGGVLFVGLERWLHGRRTIDRITWVIALAVAAGQLVAAAYPGASRSGTTILVALALGLSRNAAAEFSFLLGIPTLMAAGAKETLDALRSGETHEPWAMIALAGAVAAVTAFVVVKWLLGYVRSHTFSLFGWYRIVAGIVLLLLASRT